jgi:hypothetical protein
MKKDRSPTRLTRYVEIAETDRHDRKDSFDDVMADLVASWPLTVTECSHA